MKNMFRGPMKSVIFLFLMGVCFGLGGTTLLAQEGGLGVNATELDVDFTVARTEFEAIYQEILGSDPEVAEMMRADFEACERGEFRFTEVERAYIEQIGRDEAKGMFDTAYQEAIARGDTVGAEIMKAQFEAFERGEMPMMDPEAIHGEFEKHYQEALARGDTQAADMMKAQFEAFERGNFEAAMMSPEAMQHEYEAHYQEAMAHGDTEAAEAMKTEFEHYLESTTSENRAESLVDSKQDSFEAQHCLQTPRPAGCPNP